MAQSSIMEIWTLQKLNTCYCEGCLRVGSGLVVRERVRGGHKMVCSCVWQKRKVRRHKPKPAAHSALFISKLQHWATAETDGDWYRWNSAGRLYWGIPPPPPPALPSTKAFCRKDLRVLSRANLEQSTRAMSVFLSWWWPLLHLPPIILYSFSFLKG